MLRKFLHNSIDWLSKYSGHISCIVIVLLSVIDISNLNEWKESFWGLIDVPLGKIVYYISVTLAIIFGIGGLSNQKSITDLEKDNSEKGNKIIDLETALNDSIKEMNELFNSYLTLMVKNLGFGHTERISVYKVYEDNFVLIGRASDNPNLQKIGRSSYPIDEGLIGKGWAEGEFFIDNLPEPHTRNGDTYYTQVNQINKIDREVLRNIKMKSRTYFVFRIKGYDNQPKAVLVIESLNPNAFVKDDVINKLSGVEQPLSTQTNLMLNLLPTFLHT
ncbi:hypothetical protein GOQ04_00005 [Emticicia sp. ODNR4P]|nr:hypothetical protein [Emticicia sp. ODNR4P]